MIVFFGILLAIVMLGVVMWMLLTRRLREKYAVLWLVIGTVMLILGIFPQLLIGLAGLLGVQVPSNLLFALSIVLVLGVTLHLSWELTQAEEEIRRTAEEAAILRAQLHRLESRIDSLESNVHARDDDPR